MRFAEIINEKPVESAWISHLTYNRPNRVLTMRLSNSNAYTIAGITRTTFEKWLRAPSKGQFYHTYIKGRYPLTKIW